MNHHPSSATQVEVCDEEILFRGIHRNHIVPCENGKFRPSSAAFKDPEMSVDIASKTTPEISLRTWSGLTGLPASVPKLYGLKVIEAPILPENPAHALVIGTKTQSIAKRLATSAKWIITPTSE